jgi:hypothetical protein
MVPQIPWYVTLIAVGANLAIALALWGIVSRAAGRSGLAIAAQRRVRIGSGLLLAAWLGGPLFFAPLLGRLLTPDPRSLPLVIPFAGVAIAAVFLALWRSASLRWTLAAAPLPALVGVQFYRVLGVVFLILLAQGQLPAHFALPAGWGDIAVGLAAPLVALALARRARGSRALGITWNLFGLVDLAVAVGMGSGLLVPLLAPGLGPNPPQAVAMRLFPMILVPGFAVPVSVVLHLLALGRLLPKRLAGTSRAPVAAERGAWS